MKYNIKVFIAITALVIIIPLDGILLIKILDNKKENDFTSQKKYLEIEKNLFLIGEAVKIVNQRQPLALEVKEAATNSGLTASGSANQNITGNLRIQILNATNIAGKAGTINEKLKAANLFSEITLGNSTATSSSFLQSKKSVPATTYQKIVTLLKNDLPVFTEKVLPENETFDLVIIIGNNQ